MIPEAPSTVDLLEAELAAVSGDRCGWSCTDHHAETFRVCVRAAGHAGAQVLTDTHIGRQEATCPNCTVERADFEFRPGGHLPTCPNCGSDAEPVGGDFITASECCAG